MVWADVMQDIWLVVYDGEGVLCLATRFNVLGDQLPLDRPEVIIVSLEHQG